MPTVAVATASEPAGSGERAGPVEAAGLGPPAVVAGLVALYVAVFGHLTWRQHANWRSLGFDTGIYDQGMWLLSQGRDPFLTMRGMDYWGHHVALIGYLFAPIYWLGDGVQAVTLKLLRAAAVWLVACAAAGSYLWGIGPLSRDFDSGVWSERPRPNVAELERALATVPPQAGVAASWNVVTRFTHRPVVYEYPNPWLSSNYGPTGSEVGDPTTVDWVVVERGGLGPRDLDLLARLLAPGGGFTVVQDGSGVTVARRLTGSLALP